MKNPEPEILNPVLHVQLNVFVPWKDGSGKGDVLAAEVFIDVKKTTTNSEIMSKIKEGVVDMVTQARRHVPKPPSNLILPQNQPLIGLNGKNAFRGTLQNDGDPSATTHATPPQNSATDPVSVRKEGEE